MYSLNSSHPSIVSFIKEFICSTTDEYCALLRQIRDTSGIYYASKTQLSMQNKGMRRPNRSTISHLNLRAYNLRPFTNDNKFNVKRSSVISPNVSFANWRKYHWRNYRRPVKMRGLDITMQTAKEISHFRSFSTAYTRSQLRSMGHRGNLWRMILDLYDEVLSKKISNWSLQKTKGFFLRPLPPRFLFCFSEVSSFLESDSKLHRISSTDFKSHLKIYNRWGVIIFWNFARSCQYFSKISKYYNSPTVVYF